ncbi:MAG TPA: DNA repair exonuclease [Gemmatimonadaceae bacterium]|nr:DNA repair exonuclease [Gemmatimonadaceae bacterium]
MRLVHLSDLHLGFRQYQRLTPGGINQREADVARSFQAAMDRTIELSPELVVVAGDVFHNVRPTNPAIVHAFLQFGRLRAALPDTRVVIVAGNHDTPRAAETGSILRLFRELGIQVAFTEAERFFFPEMDLSVLAVPDIPGRRPALVPDPNATHNVLLLHGEVQGMLPAHVAASDRAAVEIPREELGASRWSYVALGHYHVYRQIEPNAYYSGSVDYTSANSWGELFEERAAGVSGKGLVEHDLSTGHHTFHPLPPSRGLVDLPAISARGLTVAEVDERIREAVEGCAGGIDDKVVRLVVRDLPRHIARDLDHRTLREYKRRALHFHLDSRRPEIVRMHGQAAPGRRPSLAEVVREKLESRLLESDIDRAQLVALGLEYLRQAEHAVVAAPAAGSAVDGSL